MNNLVLPPILYFICLLVPFVGMTVFSVRNQYIFPYIYLFIFSIEYMNPEFLGQLFTIGKIIPGFMFLVYLLSIRKNFNLNTSNILKPLVYISLYFMISLFWTENFNFSMQRGLSFIFLLCSFWFTVHITKGRLALRHFFGAFILISIVLSAFSIINFINIYALSEFVRTDIFKLNSHFTAMLIIIGTFILIISILMKRQSTWNWLSPRLTTVLVFINCLGYMATGTKTGIIAIIIMLLFIFFMRPKTIPSYKRKIFFSLFFGFFAILIINNYFPFLSNFQYRFNDLYLERSKDVISGRSFLWIQAWEYFLLNPVFGIGLESFKYNNLIFTTPHNDFLRILCEGGIIGGGLWIYLIVSCTITSLNNIKLSVKLNDSEIEFLSRCCFIIFISVFIFSLSLDLLFNKFFWIILALIESLSGHIKLLINNNISKK